MFVDVNELNDVPRTNTNTKVNENDDYNKVNIEDFMEIMKLMKKTILTTTHNMNVK